VNFISMFSGIEAASVAFDPLGWTALAFAEIEPFPSAVLAHRYPDVPNVGDMTAHDWSQYRGACDLVIGGSPCQAFSVAGLRQSLQDDRGNLSLQYVKAVHAIDPLWCITENVPGWLSTKDNAFGCFLAGLVGEDAALVPTGGRWTDAGLVDGPLRTAAWRILDAQYFGLAQRRRRVFVVSVRGSGNWRSAAALFPLTASLRRDSPPSREAREGTAPTLAARTRGGGGLGTDFDCDGGLIGPNVSPALKARDCKGPSSDGDGDGDGAPLIVHSLRADGFDASEDGTGRGTPLVAAALTGGSGKRGWSGNNGAGQGAQLIAFDPQGSGKQTTLGASSNGTGALGTTKTPAVASRSMVRRLTPRECERLMGFPDDWTLTPYRGKPAADGPRYKALGNSFAIPPVRWIGQRISAEEARIQLERRKAS
jgi:DNA (cytosine-5)-methyltransferase 1